MSDLRSTYERYLTACNDADWQTVRRAVADEVSVNGDVVSRDAYVSKIDRVKASFPDYHWKIESFIQDGDCMAVRLRDVGTHTGDVWLGVAARGRAVETTEIAMYRFVDGQIAEVWSVADNERVRDQLT